MVLEPRATASVGIADWAVVEEVHVQQAEAVQTASITAPPTPRIIQRAFVQRPDANPMVADGSRVTRVDGAIRRRS